MPEWWIDKGKVLGSSNPKPNDLKRLRKEGFKVIISLLDERKEPPNYDVKEAEVMGFKRYNIPLNDFGEPAMRQFDEVIRILKETPPSTKVCVHCGGGLGRTGTAGAAYWIKEGLSADEAIKRIRKSNPRAIETKEQEESLQRFEAKGQTIQTLTVQRTIIPVDQESISPFGNLMTRKLRGSRSEIHFGNIPSETGEE